MSSPLRTRRWAMMGLASRAPQARVRPERRSARMVLDVDFALDGLVADLLRAELDQGVEVHVVLLRPRLGWSTDAALVVLHRRRIAARSPAGGAGAHRRCATQTSHRLDPAPPLAIGSAQPEPRALPQPRPGARRVRRPCAGGCRSPRPRLPRAFPHRQYDGVAHRGTTPPRAGGSGAVGERDQGRPLLLRRLRSRRVGSRGSPCAPLAHELQGHCAGGQRWSKRTDSAVEQAIAVLREHGVDQVKHEAVE